MHFTQSTKGKKTKQEPNAFQSGSNVSKSALPPTLQLKPSNEVEKEENQDERNEDQINYSVKQYDSNTNNNNNNSFSAQHLAIADSKVKQANTPVNNIPPFQFKLNYSKNKKGGDSANSSPVQQTKDKSTPSISRNKPAPSKFALPDNASLQLKRSSDTQGIAPIQLKSMFLTQNAHAHELKNGIVNEGITGRVGKKLKSGKELNIDETNTKQSKKGNEFKMVEGSNPPAFIRSASLKENLGIGGLRNVNKTNISGEQVEEDNEEWTDDVGTTLDDTSGSLGDFQTEATEDSDFHDNNHISSKTAKNVGIAAGSIGTASGIFGMAIAIKKIKEGDGFEKVEALFDLLTSTASTVSGVSGIIKGATENIAEGAKQSQTNVNADAVGSWSGSIGGGINAIKSFVLAMKDVYETYQKIQSSEGISKGEAFEAGMSILNNLLETAGSVVGTIKGILEIFDKGVGSLAQAVPGLSIALSGADIGLRVYQMIVAGKARNEMRMKKRELKNKYSGSVGKALTHKIGNKKGQQKTDNQGNARWGTDKTKLRDRIVTLESKGNLTDAETTELQDLQELDFVLEMEYINKKRLARAGIKIGLDLLNIAGEIATLSGAGAMAGVPMKAAAAGASVSMSVFRTIKQAGRDKANKERENRLATNPQSSATKWEKVFNADKNSEAKSAKRKKDTIYIIKQIGNLPNDQTSVVFKDKKNTVESYINATGASPNAVYRGFNSKGLNGAMEVLIKSMAKRE